MKRLLPLMAAAVFALPLLCSCHSREIIPEEALQLPAHSKIYTAFNIWYEDKDAISSLNYQRGKILPFGTEVEILKAYDDSIKFRAVDSGEVFTIDYGKEWWMMPIEDYMKNLFTTKDPDEIAKTMKPAAFEKIRRGIAEEGMTRDQVLLAYGYPTPYRTPSIKDDTWIYWTDAMSGKRAVFNGDKLVAIISID